MNKFADDLGFTYLHSKSGDVQIYHHGKRATTLRTRKAEEFMTNVSRQEFADQQQLMARMTENYKRGNERIAKSHSRNRH